MSFGLSCPADEHTTQTERTTASIIVLLIMRLPLQLLHRNLRLATARPLWPSPSRHARMCLLLSRFFTSISVSCNAKQIQPVVRLTQAGPRGARALLHSSAGPILPPQAVGKILQRRYPPLVGDANWRTQTFRSD